MARETYVLRDGKLVTKAEAYAMAAGDRSGPFVISDSMDPIRSMADGRMYDSKSAYYRSVRAAGCEIVGNDTASLRHRPTELPRVAPDIARAIQQHS
jgi:hypothetical protein